MKKSEFIHIRISPEEKKKLEKLARSQNKTKSQILRELIERSLKK